MLANISTVKATSGDNENWLSHSDVSDYLERIEVSIQPPCHNFLQEIVSGTLAHLPFQNLSMLTDERSRPSPQKICSDMLSGLGGLCTIRNPFLFHLLTILGFNVRFASASMDRQNCHIVLVVQIDDEDWWVDVGNGYPYQYPIKLGDESPKIHPFLKYRIVSRGNQWVVEHFRNDIWETNYTFFSEGVDFSSFDEMHDLHYSKPGWGPFLTGLRVNRWWGDDFVILRDHVATSPDGEEILDSPKKIHNWILKWFPKSGFLNNVNVTESYYVWKFELGLINQSQNQVNQIHQLVGGDVEERGFWQFELMKSVGLTPRHEFLDYGCGTLRGGLHFIPYLQSGNYTGMDTNPLFIRIANRLIEQKNLEESCPKILSTESVDSLNDDFDYVLTQSVLNHLDVDQLTHLIEKISNLLRDDGTWVSTVCYDKSIDSFQMNSPHPFRPNESLNSRFNPQWFESLLSDFGFVVEEFTEIPHPHDQFNIVLIKKRRCNDADDNK